MEVNSDCCVEIKPGSSVSPLIDAIVEDVFPPTDCAVDTTPVK